MISFADRASIPANVLIRFLDQESVLLNLNTEKYFGLDSVGTRMWQLVTAAPSVEAAYNQLIEEFDVEPETPRSNLSDLLARKSTFLAGRGTASFAYLEFAGARVWRYATHPAEIYCVGEERPASCRRRIACGIDDSHGTDRSSELSDSLHLSRTLTFTVVAARSPRHRHRVPHRGSQR